MKVLTNLVNSDKKLRQEVVTDVKTYMKKPCSLDELSMLDDLHVFDQVEDDKIPT